MEASFILSTLWNFILVAISIKLVMNCIAESSKFKVWLPNFPSGSLFLRQNKRT